MRFLGIPHSTPFKTTGGKFKAQQGDDLNRKCIEEQLFPTAHIAVPMGNYAKCCKLMKANVKECPSV